MAIAVVDMGTHTFRLLIADVLRGKIKTIYSENKTVQLGEGFSGKKFIKPAGMERAIVALSSFQRTMKQYDIGRLSVIGTSAMREAVNQKPFLLLVQEALGWSVDVISGEEEARLTFLGANQVIQNREGPMLLVDIGGGSTEFIVANGEQPRYITSLPLGVIPLMEQYRGEIDPLKSCNAMRFAIKQVIQKIAHALPIGVGIFAGTAGTVTTLAAMDQKLTRYDTEKINRYMLCQDAVREILKKILAMPIQKRLSLPGLESGREEVIVPGILILLTIMEVCQYDLVYASEYGVREGLLIDRVRSNGHL
ncbi:MAG: Ppx/GppA phosphatase family protein [Nitrospirota bacterium]